MNDNILEQSINTVTVNPDVHEIDEHGDPVRNQDGTIRLQSNWKKSAKDRQGRTFNPKIHQTNGKDPVLDDAGFIKVRRRGETQLVGTTNRSEAFVAKHKEEGYAYYIMNDEGGRMDSFLANDWEPVQGDQGPAQMKVGLARDHGTNAFLMRKPIEWYEEDQKRKRQRNDQVLEDSKSPDQGEGQYEANPESPLR